MVAAQAADRVLVVGVGQVAAGAVPAGVALLVVAAGVPGRAQVAAAGVVPAAGVARVAVSHLGTRAGGARGVS